MHCPLLSFRNLSAAFLTTPRGTAHGWTFMEYMTAPFRFSFLISRMIAMLPHSAGLGVLLLSLLLDRDNLLSQAINNDKYVTSTS